MMQLTDRKILVTGSSRGIGRAIALRLAALGADLALHYHGEEGEAAAVAAEVRETGRQADIFPADFGEPMEARRLGESVWERFGPIDVLVNNAGISYKKHFLEQDVEDVEAFTNVNFKSTLYLTQSIAARMVKGGICGSILTVTSVNGIKPGAGFSVYGATKGALETLMVGVALDLAPYGIRVNTLVPGAIHTEMNRAVWEDPQKLEGLNRNIPLQRMGTAEEVANVVCALLQADSYMTGASIRVDGGWLIQGVQRQL